MTTGFTTDRTGTWIEKGPDENLLYVADIGRWMEEASDPGPILSQTVTCATLGITGVTLVGETVEFMISPGGDLKSKHPVVVQWSTAKNPLASRTFTVRVVDR